LWYQRSAKRHEALAQPSAFSFELSAKLLPLPAKNHPLFAAFTVLKTRTLSVMLSLKIEHMFYLHAHPTRKEL